MKPTNNNKIANWIKIKPIQSIDIGYGAGRLRPTGSRQPETERRILAKLNMLINGMSGQLND